MHVITAQKELLKFNDGSKFVSSWEYDCCEYNYADFSIIALDSEIMNNEFESVCFGRVEDEAGFTLLFKGLPHKTLGTYTKHVFVPCYSDQNGYYTTELEVSHYDAKGKETIFLNCDMHNE